MHFQNLEFHFSPGFVAEGRHGRAKKLENEQNSLKTHFQNLEGHFPPGFFAEGRRGLAKKLVNSNMGISMGINMGINMGIPYNFSINCV